MTDSNLQLSLWKQHLAHVPESVWEKRELETLVLAENDLREISSRIASLQRLRMLDLGHNRLEKIPAQLGELTALRDFLYLHDNHLTDLPI